MWSNCGYIHLLSLMCGCHSECLGVTRSVCVCVSLGVCVSIYMYIIEIYLITVGWATDTTPSFLAMMCAVCCVIRRQHLSSIYRYNIHVQKCIVNISGTRFFYIYMNLCVWVVVYIYTHSHTRYIIYTDKDEKDRILLLLIRPYIFKYLGSGVF